MSYRERVLDGERASAHVAQLFDGRESLGAAVTTFIREGLEREETVLAVMTPDHWKIVSKRLMRLGMPPAEIMTRGELIVRNAADVLACFMRRGGVADMLFEGSIGTLVRKLRRQGAPLRMYGEMVDLLALEGNLNAAVHVEQLWNDLAQREPFTLFCGYSAANFGDPRAADALRQICLAHSHIRSHRGDMLASYLLHTDHDDAFDGTPVS